MALQRSRVFIANDPADAALRAGEIAPMDLSRRLIQAQEEERARIAGELHDDINQRLALLANGLLMLKQSFHSAPIEEHVGELWQLSCEIMDGIQQLSRQLHPSMLHYLGLASTARKLCDDYSRQHGIEVELDAHGLPEDLDEDVGLSLFRMLQEALRNVVKHSRAQHVEVVLACVSSHIRLRVSDDGLGFDPQQAKDHGLGLVSMRERLRSVGGEFSISSQPSLGTQVEGTVPLKRKPRLAQRKPQRLPGDFDCVSIKLSDAMAPSRICEGQECADCVCTAAG